MTLSGPVVTVSRLSRLTEILAQWRAQELTVALVSTLGSLHRGHLALVKAAARQANRVVVCAYPNPLQFAPGDRQERYPRAHEKDAEAILGAGGHVLFTPADFDLFPIGVEGGTLIDIPDLTQILCGRSRPALYPGLLTVAVKLLHAIRPNVLVVGEKDYQLLVLLRRVTADLLLPVTVASVPTVREHDGLAMATGNRQLSLRERNIASRLYEMLTAIRRRVLKGERDYEVLQDFGMKILERAGFSPEYVAIRQVVDLSPAREETQHFAVFAAARLGAARLSDNIVFKTEAAQRGPDAS